MTTNTHTLQIEEILELLPHRFPFLLVDRVLDFEEGRFLRAVKNVSVNEPFFQGHFPGKPIFPGVLILEAMAQATGILAFKSVGKLEPGELYYFAGIDEARFKRPVVPGDQMIMEVTFEKTRRGLTRFKGVALVDGKVVCEATMMCARSREARYVIDKSAFVHPTAIVEEGASIGANAHIGPFCIVGPHVEIGEGTVLKSHVVVNGHTKIGRDNEIYQFASIGEVNQDLKYAGEPTRVEIGDRNRIRESVTIHRGTVQGGGLTKVGSDNLLMINAHIAHDCTVGNRCILANNATLAGHVSVDDFAIIGGMTAVHQFCIIGAHVMVGGCSGVAQDVPPYVIAQGNHATPFGVNIEGLKRRGFSREAITAIRNAYKLIYRSGKTLDEVKPEIAELAETYPEVKAFTDFFARSTRGLIR